MRFKDRLYQFIISRPFRYSGKFLALQRIFNYTPFESVLQEAMLFTACSRLAGDYLEFGVYRGRSFTAAFHLAQCYNLNSMRFYAFDSFQGLPRQTGSEGKPGDIFKEGDYCCSETEFRKILLKRKVDSSKITLIPGWYHETLSKKTKKELPIKKAAVVYFDCDLYESAVLALDFTTDYVQDGTIFIFDDWFLFKGNPNKGEQKAFREWLEKNPSLAASEFYRFPWGGNSFIIHR